MPRRSARFLAVTIATTTLLLAGCDRKPAPLNDSVNEAEPEAGPNVAMTSPVGSGGDEEAAGTLVPPAPGEPGGLPDDREPLNEGAARNPVNVEASGATIERWGFALGEKRYADAYKLWRDDGQASGMTAAQFAQSYSKYSEIHVLIGRPQATGADTVRVPVQMYGRLRETGEPFNLLGPMTLARNPGGQPAWLITASELKARGTVKVLSQQADAGPAVPAAFRGNWSSSRGSCGKPGDDTRLAVTADSLTFYESVGHVTQLRRVSPQSVRLTAEYNGEGDKWSDDTTLVLSGQGDVLTIDKVRRVRCPAG